MAVKPKCFPVHNIITEIITKNITAVCNVITDEKKKHSNKIKCFSRKKNKFLKNNPQICFVKSDE